MLGEEIRRENLDADRRPLRRPHHASLLQFGGQILRAGENRRLLLIREEKEEAASPSPTST